MNHQDLIRTSRLSVRRVPGHSACKLFRRWRRHIGAFLCCSVLALQFAIVWHDADHLWHDTHHDSAICAVAAANPAGGVVECPDLTVPRWSVVGALVVPAVRAGAIAVMSPYYSRAPPQSVG